VTARLRVAQRCARAIDGGPGHFFKDFAISALVMHMHCSMSDARQWRGQMENMKDKGDEHGQ
jgi:hypothetical protein